MVKRIIFLLGLLWVPFWAGTASAAIPAPSLQQLQEDVNQAVASVRQAVVTVKARKKSAAAGGGTLWYESIGSGFFVDARGFVLTNHHVVKGAEEITATIWRSGQNEFQARIVQTDEALDLSLLKIDAQGVFPVAAFGNSNRIETGDWVISVGSPFGFEHSVSLGIVSDLHRDLLIEGLTYKDMIQTDAVINEGNSGGPLVDIFGKVIGVGTAIYAPDGTYTGLGFAIPINRAKHFFTRSTGAVRVAMNTPAVQAGAKEPINLNKRIPNDAIHKEFSDCTTCHTITQKLVVSRNAEMKHKMVGACDTCHIFVKDKVASGPVTVANTRPLPPFPTDQVASLYTDIILKLAMITLVISIVFTMMGLGGGFLYVPILLSCGLEFHSAVTTSLVMLTAAQVSGLYIFFRSHLVDVKMAVRLGLPTMLGAFVGGIFSEHFNVNFLVILFALTMFFASYVMIQDENRLTWIGKRLPLSSWVWPRDFVGYTYDLDMMVSTPLTFCIGFMGGLLGLAGGWLNIPLMVLLFGVPMKIAIATSSLMVPATGFAGILGHSVLVGHFEIKLALSLSIITIIGAQIGSRISVKTDSNLLKFVFAFVLSLVGLWMILMVL